MSADWDEIKKLAADFQKAQLSSTLLRLSERNCVEIVTLLLEKKLLDVVFTNDGKEYITPDHLEREIQDELYANGGRVNLVEVSKALNVDLSRIEHIAERISGNNTGIHFMLGQLIDEDYITSIAEEINEKLAQRGELAVSDLAEHFDLPSEFLLHNVVEKHLGRIIRGRQDPFNPRILFTQAYIQRCKAKVRGALAAITQPINVSAILQHINVPEKIFHSVFDDLSPAGQLTSKLANAQYVPSIYAKMQTDWVTSFFKQNGFIEYEAFTKLGISDPKQFLSKQFPNEEIMYLKRAAIGAKIIDLIVLTSLNECNAAKTYVDLAAILPSNMSEQDVEEVFNTIIMKKACNTSNFVFIDGIVFSQYFLTELMQPCNEVAALNAKAAIESGIYQQYLAEKQLASKTNAHDYDDDIKLDKRDERRKKASAGKMGGGSQGRETKTKSVKKHQRGGRGAAVNAESDDDNDARVTHQNKKAVKALELVSVDDIEKIIIKSLSDEGLDHLCKTIALLYYSQFNQLALNTAQELFEATPQTNRRQTHAAIQEKINTLLIDIRLYEKGLKHFPTDVQVQLVKYLLKSLGNDVCNEITAYVANECNLTLKTTTLNVDQRMKVAQESGSAYKSVLIEMNKAVNKTIEEFLISTEAALKECSMIIKKVDKKKDRLLMTQHKEKLVQQLQENNEPAFVLHLTALILFTTITGNILHASGKFVAQILSFIRPHMSNEQNELLMRYHDLVLKVLQTGATNDETKEINEKLIALQTSIIELANTFEKPGVFKTE